GADAGDTVTYSYVVTNTGNVTLTGITVKDDNEIGRATCRERVLILGTTTLAPGASTTGTATRTLTQTQVDAGSVHDIALATGSPPTGSTVTASDDATVPIAANPHIAVDKTAGSIADTDANGADAGDTVTYSYVVTNTGNVTLTGITVKDDN